MFVEESVEGFDLDHVKGDHHVKEGGVDEVEGTGVACAVVEG